MSLEQVQAQLNDAGFNLTGTLSPEAFDTLVPETWRSRDCASLVIVGNGGRALWSEFQRAPESLLREDPLDAYTARVLGEIAHSVDPPAAVGLYWEQRRGDYLPMMKLAERAGLGSPSRLGILLHPEFGPWLAVRAVLYLPFAVASGDPLRFDPCSECPAPCATACHGDVVHETGLDPTGCFRTRVLHRACRTGCAARSACVVGPEHAYSPAQFRHHQRIRWRPSVIRHAARVVLTAPPRRSR